MPVQKSRSKRSGEVPHGTPTLGILRETGLCSSRQIAQGANICTLRRGQGTHHLHVCVTTVCTRGARAICRKSPHNANSHAHHHTENVIPSGQTLTPRVSN